MLQGMDQSEFGQFVAALWEQQGWQAQVKQDDGRTFVAVQRPQTGEEGLLWAVPGNSEIGGQEVQQFRSLCDEYGVEEGGVVTAGTLSDHARKVAEGTGLELLDGEAIETLLERKGMTDLLEQYGGGGSSAGDSSGGSASDAGDGDSPLDKLEALGGRATDLVSDATDDVDIPVSRTAAIAIVVVVALISTGVLVGPSLPFIGGGNNAISAASASPDGSATTLRVKWNAKVVDEIDVNRSDELAYYSPEGQQFVVVRLSVNNTGSRKVAVKQAAFDLRTDEQTYDQQTLADHDGFLDFPISPGQHYVGWTVFSVPEGTTGTLVYDQNETGVPVSVTFERDQSLSVNVTRQ